MTDKKHQLLEILHQQGKERFGSVCKHEESKKGFCVNCLRRVRDK